MNGSLRRFLLATIILHVLAVPMSARATTWLPPARPLTEDEWLEAAVSESDAIGFGFVAAVHDTIVDPGFQVRSLTLRPTEWLKGGPTGSIIEVWMSAFDGSPLFSDLLMAQGLDRTPALFFLERVGAGWALREQPKPAAVQLLSDEDKAMVERRVRSLIARQSPDSLLARADLVFIGRRGEPDASCALKQGGIRSCMPVMPEEFLVGDSLVGPLRVYSVMLGQIPAGDVLFLLKKMPDGLYETVGFRSGSLAVSSGGVERWGLSIGQVRGKARELSATRSRMRSGR